MWMLFVVWLALCFIYLSFPGFGKDTVADSAGGLDGVAHASLKTGDLISTVTSHVCYRTIYLFNTKFMHI